MMRKIMEASGAQAWALLFVLQLVQILAVSDIHVAEIVKDVGALSVPSTLDILREYYSSLVDLSNLTVSLPALPLPPGSSGTCHVAIGQQIFVTEDISTHPARHLLQAPMSPPKMAPKMAPMSPPMMAPKISPPMMAPPMMGPMPGIMSPPMSTVEVWTANQLVQALLAGNPTIIIANNIALGDSVPLPGIMQKVTIMGNCMDMMCRLDAQGQGNIFQIGIGGYLTLKDLDLRNGVCTQGGAILVSGSGAIMSTQVAKFVALNVHFFNNTATDVGGALAVMGGAVAYYHGCVFIANSAPRGGAIYIGSADMYPVVDTVMATTLKPVVEQDAPMAPSMSTMSPMYMTPPDAMMPGCSLSSCSSSVDTLFLMNTANQGGAVYIDDSSMSCSTGTSTGGTIDVTNSRFQNNSAQDSGGAIFLGWRAAGAAAHIKSSDFVGNAAMNTGGDITMDPALAPSQGVHLFAYETQFSGTVGGPMNQHAEVVDVGMLGNATFSKCKFPVSNSVNCMGGSSCEFCPPKSVRPKLTTTTLQSIAETLQPPSAQPVPVALPWPANLATAPMMTPMMAPIMPPVVMTCPVPTEKLCGWVPMECLPPPPIVSQPPPMSSPPPPSPPSPVWSPPPPSPPPPSPPPLGPPPPPSPPPSPSPPPPIWSPPPPTWSPPPPPTSPPPPSPSPPPPSPPPPSPPPPASPPPPSPPPPASPPPPVWSPPPPVWSPPPPETWSPPPPTWSPPPPMGPPPPVWSPPPPTWSPPPPTWGPPPPPYTTPPPPMASPPPPPMPTPPPLMMSPPPPMPDCSMCPPAKAVGKRGSIHGDPHFLGKHGEKFDFQGVKDTDYCVVSDKNVHVNMHVFPGIHRGTTFISQIGVLYKESYVLVDAQASSNANSKFEDQWKLLVNNVEVKPHHDFTTKDGLLVHRVSKGARITVGGELDMNITIRPPTFTPRGSGKNYVNFKIDKLKTTPQVHGVLGQTYQETRQAYKKLHDARHKHKGQRATNIFVDGKVEDYVTSDILAPDCKFNRFEGQKNIVKRIHRALMSTAGAIFTDEVVEEVVDTCTGFGEAAFDCALNLD